MSKPYRIEQWSGRPVSRLFGKHWWWTLNRIQNGQKIGTSEMYTRREARDDTVAEIMRYDTSLIEEVIDVESGGIVTYPRPPVPQ